MKTAIYKHWHAWQATSGILLSDESAKKLRQFADIDACVNFLFLNGDKEAARAINSQWKGK